MNLYILSDLHLEFAPFTPPTVDCDVVVLAGDTDLKLRGVRWAIETFPNRPVLYVFGNHEFYHQKWPSLIDMGRELAAGTTVRILENDTVEIDGWRFFGATLWTDFAIDGDIEAASRKAADEMSDFHRIRYSTSGRPFTPAHSRAAHAESLNALQRFLQRGDRERSVVISHHAPSPRSLPESYRDERVRGAYASALEPLITEMGPRLWVHGHVHAQFDYAIGSTRVIANPRGYPGELAFREGLVVSL